MSQLEAFDQESIAKIPEILEELVDLVNRLTEAVNSPYVTELIQSYTELNETLKDHCSLLREQRK